MDWNVNNISAFIFDLDGCIYSGNKVYEGSKELLTYLIDTEKEIFFLSNNSTDQAKTVRQKLINMGLPVGKTTILVATELIGEYLYETYGSVHVLPIGTEQLKESLQEQGHKICLSDREDSCDFVVVGRDTSFTYDTLHKCTKYVMNGAKLIATNLDLFHPGEDGYRVPETGALIAAIQAVSGIEEVQVVGKPFIFPFNKITQKTGLTLNNCVMVGDNPYTDVAGAHAAGVKTFWISHGQSFPSELGYQPDLTCKSMKELAEIVMTTYSKEKEKLS
ncbi:HAD superfamily hydrolase (TIGR01450 family) [Chryseomicrobium aureum]|uniref:HAD-IIA family hydrolase n=1 Tax=Chryseomicrobium aureum TaxID=1441723 RepID=UPI001956D019|nr:HAD-IIA family hydrolase [Chryseomicrobium aureum]MBM7707099.1 HAD superfamily hydrolase (TIGR01450 family) [Chryseomicrobium aureum]